MNVFENKTLKCWKMWLKHIENDEKMINAPWNWKKYEIL